MTLEQISSNLFTLIGVPIIIYGKADKRRNFQEYNLPKRIEETIEEQRSFVKENITDYSVYNYRDISGLSYCAFKVLESTIMIGPFLEQNLNPKAITNLSRKLKLIHTDRIQLELLLNSLIQMNSEELNFIYHMISNITHSKYYPPEFKRIKTEEVSINNFKSRFELNREQFIVKKNYEVEKQYLSAIEYGDIDKVNSFKTADILQQLPKRAPQDTLRSLKVKLNILNTLCNRAALRGGVDTSTGHRLETNFNNIIKATDSLVDSIYLSKEIVIRYTNAVREHTLQTYSKLVKNAILSIKANISERYSLGDLADDLLVSREHLAREFKKETSVTVSEYIGQVKMDEAKKILVHTDLSISAIAEMLGYSNSTYFSNTFKKHTGNTPRKYRQQERVG